MRILSYNIRKGVGRDGRRDPDRITRVLAASGADVVVLQEADLRLGPRRAAVPRFLLEAETPYRAVDVSVNDVSLGWHGNAILVRDGVTVLGAARLALPGLEPRGAVRVDLDMPGIGPVTVVGAHLGLLRPWRRRQLRAIRQHLSPAERARAVVAGDFNEWAARTGFEPLGRAFTVHAPGRSFPARYPVAALDRFAHGRAMRVAASGVLTGGLERQASDHLPVWAEIAPA